MKKVKEVKILKSGKVVFSAASVQNEDWILAGRLKRAAEAGDTAAANRLQQMRETSMLQE